MAAYYNENDPKAAAWLRELIKQGLIASGDVDECSIEEIHAADLKGFTQCHFFAGIGVWSDALRRAGWSDDHAVWTGSCPCQSFSASGQRGGFSDQRHLWPAWFRLIRECRPDVCFGEQVASKDGLAWFDVVSADLEGAGYTIGAIDLCAAGVGAPNIRQRLYFVAHTEKRERGEQEEGDGRAVHAGGSETRKDGLMADSLPTGWPEGRPIARNGQIAGSSGPSELAYPHQSGEHGRPPSGEQPLCHEMHEADGVANAEVTQRRRTTGQTDGGGGHEEARGPGLTNGFWKDADWLYCRDGKYRPVEPGTFPLAHGAAARMGRLRGYGNAINAEAAKAFIEAYQEVRIEFLFK